MRLRIGLGWLLAALVALFQPSAFGQSPEFRRAVEAGHRTRLRQMLPQGTAVEFMLAEPDLTPLEVAGLTRPEENASLVHKLEAQFALASGDDQEVIQAASSWLGGEDEAANAEAQWLLALGEFRAGQWDHARERADWLSQHAAEPWKGWGLFARGQSALATGDTAEALRLFKSCTQLKKHEAAGSAYLELGRVYGMRAESETAMRYLTLYREAYPRGLIPELASTPGASERADRAAGVEFCIQVGVFGDKGNADRLRKKFVDAGYQAELVPRVLSGQHYTAVWVGHYRTQNEAQDARRKLEEQFSESYRVMARE